ncbi:MazG-like family protein [Streptomyces kaniharaensis]|uniref:MazG-like family protein n=1 Tax=Streptomyces kaniharaensis TaxID=212423 RepID=UPI001E4BF059|nr:MazG-like family protein [Streptomyces kaniharaensis]
MATGEQQPGVRALENAVFTRGSPGTAQVDRTHRTGAGCDAMTDSWEIINSLAEKLNSLSTVPHEQELLGQALKLAEETGEVAEAAIGALSMNPRNGNSHTWDDVRKEACDVAATALILIARTGADPRDIFESHLHFLQRRSLTGEATE